MDYRAPIEEQAFVLDTIADLRGLAALPAFAALDPDLAQAVLREGARLTEAVFAPLNRIGDVVGATWSREGVAHPSGFADAYAAYVEGGWASLACDVAEGGQGLPLSLATAFNEQLTSANMAFSLCMILSSGAVEALRAYGSPELNALYLPKLVSGEWTGAMNLTEPQAGSDVGALRASAAPAEDGAWRIMGTKIYITWGEHELAENIVHLVLARTPGSPAGTRGISLFLVPKFLPDAEGRPGLRNDLRCLSIEHKLGIHASPTCTMSFGDEGNCIGWLVGEEHGGMRAMFKMMNHARLNVGLEGVAIAERAYQDALGYARERVQSALSGGGPSVHIIEHPDVRRMLMTMRATTQAIRAIAYLNAAAIDRAHAEPDAERRREAQGLADLLTPINKGYATDMGVEMASLGLQVFGGMGFIEETGAAQHYRDIRIAPIYEGTNGIQAMDLVARKLRAEQGIHWRRLIAEMEDFVAAISQEDELGRIRMQLAPYVDSLGKAATALTARDGRESAAAATPFLRMFGIVLGAYLLARQAAAATEQLANHEGDVAFLQAKIATARFFAEAILPEAAALGTIVDGSSADLLFAIPEEQLAA